MGNASLEREHNINYILLRSRNGDQTEEQIILDIAIDRGLSEFRVTQYVDMLVRANRIERTEEPYPKLRLTEEFAKIYDSKRYPYMKIVYDRR